MHIDQLKKSIGIPRILLCVQWGSELIFDDENRRHDVHKLGCSIISFIEFMAPVKTSLNQQEDYKHDHDRFVNVTVKVANLKRHSCAHVWMSGCIQLPRWGRLFWLTWWFMFILSLHCKISKLYFRFISCLTALQFWYLAVAIRLLHEPSFWIAIVVVSLFVSIRCDLVIFRKLSPMSLVFYVWLSFCFYYLAFTKWHSSFWIKRCKCLRLKSIFFYLAFGDLFILRVYGLFLLMQVFVWQFKPWHANAYLYQCRHISAKTMH